jgi:hypothetical protein
MFSRAHLLIQKQLNDLENDPKILISRLNNDNIFELIALIEGQKNTLFENGVFQVYMKFTGMNIFHFSKFLLNSNHFFDRKLQFRTASSLFSDNTVSSKY